MYHEYSRSKAALFVCLFFSASMLGKRKTDFVYFAFTQKWKVGREMGAK